jgi:hypothetical protein
MRRVYVLIPILISMIFCSCTEQKEKDTQKSSTIDDSPTTWVKDSEGIYRPPITKPDTTSHKQSSWIYKTEEDPMGRGVIHLATVQSKNSVNFGFPYSGEQHAILGVRRHPKYGNEIYLQIERGQFLIGFDGKNFSIRFDEKPVMKFWAVGPDDNSTTIAFMKSYDRFVRELKTAKTVRIEAPFYQEGTRVFEFDVSAFKPN